MLDTGPTAVIGRMLVVTDSALVLYRGVRRFDVRFDQLSSLAFLNLHDHQHTLVGLTLVGGVAGGASAVLMGRRSIKRAGIGAVAVAPVYAAIGEVVGMFATYNVAAHWLNKPASWDAVPLDSLRRAVATPP